MNIFKKAVEFYNYSVITKFLFNAIILYFLWFVFYENRTSTALRIDNAMLNHLTVVSKKILIWMGYTLFEEPENIYGIVGSSGIKIGSPCNGISLIALFSGFIIAFPSTFKKKIGVLISGVVIIHVLNIFRIVALVVLAYYHRDWLEFNHDYTFTLIVYTVTFIMWVGWVNSLTKQANQKKES